MTPVVGTGLAHQAAPIRYAMERAPGSWRWSRLKYVASINTRSLPEDTDPDYEFEYIDISAVTLGKINSTAPKMFRTAPSRARRIVLQGDIIISTVRTYLKAIARSEEERDDVICSNGFAVLTAGPQMDPTFLYLWVISRPFVEEIAARSTGVGYPAVTPFEIGDIACPVPPLEEQRRIAEEVTSALGWADAVRDTIAREARLLDERSEALVASHVMGQLK